MTKEALKLALEALKENHYYMIDAGLPNQSMLNKGFAAFKACEQALAAPEQEPVALETVYETIIHWDENGGKRSRRELARCIVDLYTTPPAAQQEPAGCACRWNGEGDRTVTCERHQGWLEVIAEWADRAREAEAKLKAIPPAAQRQWVGLTRQQKKLIERISVDEFDAMHRTEAKLKEKNT